MSVMIIYAYLDSVSRVPSPLHGCWQSPTHLLDVYNSLGTALKYVFDILYCVDPDVSSHTKKHHQGNNNSNRSRPDLYQVHHDIQNKKGVWRWNAQPYFLHENLESFIVCVLSRWNLVIHTVSPKLDIIDLIDGLYIQSLE